MKLRIVNWSEYQHYRDRCPPWVRLHWAILTSDVWVTMDDASRVLAICSILLASRDKTLRGEFNADPEYVRRVCYLNQTPDWGPLLAVGFVEVVNDASKPLATASTMQAKCTQSRAETETETEQTQIARAHEEPPQPTPDQTGPATQLLSLLQSSGAWNHRDHGFTALAELGRLIEARGERETLEEAKWYAEHHGDRYAPSICGIRDLDRWPKIRAAMARHAQESRMADNGLSLLDEADRLERERKAKK